MPNNDTPIRVWAEIRKITELLRKKETWLCVVENAVFGRTTEHPREELIALQAIFEQYGKQIEKELPEDLRGVDWLELSNIALSRLETFPGPNVARLRVDLFVSLHEVAARAVAKYNAATLAGAEQGGDGTDNRPAKKPRQTPKARKRKREPRQADAEMMEVHTAHQSGLSFRAIAAHRKSDGLKGTSATTLSKWYRLADAFLNPKSRSKRVRHTLPEDRRGQTDVSEDRRRDLEADDGE